jgi:hypothetical protein
MEFFCRKSPFVSPEWEQNTDFRVITRREGRNYRIPGSISPGEEKLQNNRENLIRKEIIAYP